MKLATLKKKSKQSKTSMPLLVNRYRVIKKIGQGSMGVVWRVFDTVDQREVALKQIYRKAGLVEDLEASLRFKQEFWTMSKLKHPNTVEVYNYGLLEKGDDYLTMELVEGEELKDILEKRQLSYPEMYHILIQVARVLSFIHSRLLVHRDIKSSNIRINSEGLVKLMDFGLMTPLGQLSNGEITGTATYMPPEIPQGGIIDSRSDLYSIGILAYEMVAGKPPFTNEKISEIIKKHIHSVSPKLKKIRSDISKEFESMIDKLLSKRQDSRYQKAGDLLNDLLHLSGEPISEESLEEKKSYLFCSELIGRQRELQWLDNAFSQIQHGEGRSCFVAAPAGIGKSRLIQEFRLKVQLAEVTFVEGQCFEQGMTPYQPLADAFRSLIPLVQQSVLDKYGSVLVKVIPELKKKGFKALSKLDEVGEKVRLFETVGKWLKEIAATSPVVIFIEDLHWADSSTLELLNACIRETADSPVMILGSFRDDEIDEASMIFQTIDEKATQLMQLSPLNKEDVNALIQGMLGKVEISMDFVECVYEATAGNTFFVSETIRVLIEEEKLQLDRGRWILPLDTNELELPHSIEATISRRLKNLNYSTLKIARMAAVVGRGSDLSLLKSLSAIDDQLMFGFLDELIKRQFMIKEDNLYTLTHERVRETLYQQIDKTKRLSLHEKCGEILERRYLRNSDDIAINELAYHFSSSNNKQKAVKYLLKAGDEAMKINAFVKAISMFKDAERLLEESNDKQKKWTLLEVWDKLTLASIDTESKNCIEYGEKLINELSSLSNIKGGIKMIKGIFETIDRLPPSVGNMLKDKLVQNDPPSLTQLRPHNRIEQEFNKVFPKQSVIIPNLILAKCYIAAAYTLSGNFDKSLKIQDEVIEDIPDKRSTSFATVLLSRAVTLEFLGHHKKICQHLRDAIDIFESQKGLTRKFCWLYVNCIWLHELVVVWRGLQLTDQGKLLEKGFVISKDNNFIDILFWHHYVNIHYWTLRGNKDKIDSIKDIMLEILKKMGRPEDPDTNLAIDLAQAAMEQGEWETAENYARRGLELGEKRMQELHIEFSRVLLGVCAFEQGHTEESLKYLNKAIRDSKKSKVERLIPALYHLGEIFYKCENYPKAEELLREAHELAISDELENPYYQIHTFRILGQIALKRKNYVQAEDLIQKSLNIAEENEIFIQKGRTLLALAELQSKLTKHTFAKKSLGEAERIFKQIDNPYLCEKVRQARKKIK